MKVWQRTYLRRFIAGMAGYALLLVLSLLLIGSQRLGNPLVTALVALLPMLPLGYAMAAVVGNVRQLDELQRRTHLEAVLYTAFITGGLTFSYGLLEAAGLAPSGPMILVAPLMIVVWGLANIVLGRRYD